MRRNWKLTSAVCLAAVLLVVGYISRGAQTRQAQQAQRTEQSSPSAEQNPFETLDKLLASIQREQGGESARDRCLAKQRARLKSCETKRGQEQVVCEAVAKELISVCEEMNPKAPAYLAGLLFCNGICASIPAPTGKCIGRVCASPPGQVCEPGVIWNCECTTHYSRPLTNTTFCSCSCS